MMVTMVERDRIIRAVMLAVGDRSHPNRLRSLTVSHAGDVVINRDDGPYLWCPEGFTFEHRRAKCFVNYNGCGWCAECGEGVPLVSLRFVGGTQVCFDCFGGVVSELQYGGV